MKNSESRKMPNKSKSFPEPRREFINPIEINRPGGVLANPRPRHDAENSVAEQTSSYASHARGAGAQNSRQVISMRMPIRLHESGPNPSTDHPREAVSYARISSKEQELGYSLDAQTALLRAKGADLNVTVQEFFDVETAKTVGRPGFGAMVAYLRKHPNCRILLVEKTDRLYRNLKDHVTIDELKLDIHLVKENVVLTPHSRSSESSCMV